MTGLYVAAGVAVVAMLPIVAVFIASVQSRRYPYVARHAAKPAVMAPAVAPGAVTMEFQRIMAVEYPDARLMWQPGHAVGGAA